MINYVFYSVFISLYMNNILFTLIKSLTYCYFHFLCVRTLGLREFLLCARNYTYNAENILFFSVGGRVHLPKFCAKFTRKGKEEKNKHKDDVFLRTPKDFSHGQGR